jgi:hypothetical protein
MTTSPFITSNHPASNHPAAHGFSIPARRPTRKFTPAPVHTSSPAPISSPSTSDDLSAADAVLALLRSINSKF